MEILLLLFVIAYVCFVISLLYLLVLKRELLSKEDADKKRIFKFNSALLFTVIIVTIFIIYEYKKKVTNDYLLWLQDNTKYLSISCELIVIWGLALTAILCVVQLILLIVKYRKNNK